MDDAISHGEILGPGLKLFPFMKTSKNKVTFDGYIVGTRWIEEAAVRCGEYVMLIKNGSPAGVPS